MRTELPLPVYNACSERANNWMQTFNSYLASSVMDSMLQGDYRVRIVEAGNVADAVHGPLNSDDFDFADE